MDDVVVARALHVLAVVIWIGGVAMVTMIVLPAVRRGDLGAEPASGRSRPIEQRFAWQARSRHHHRRIDRLLHDRRAWICGRRFRSAEFWWMHAMVGLWLSFTLILFVAEPLVLHRWFHGGRRAAPEAAFALAASGSLAAARAQPDHHPRRRRGQPGVVPASDRRHRLSCAGSRSCATGAWSGSSAEWTTIGERRKTMTAAEIDRPDGGSRQQRAQMDPAGRRCRDASRFSAGRPGLTYEAAPPFPTASSSSDGTAPDDSSRYSGRQGRLSESRSDGLRQPLWHGVVFRGGLHRRLPCSARHADRRKHRRGEDRQGAVGTDRGGASRRSRRRCRPSFRASI